jgi:hypothetical protein
MKSAILHSEIELYWADSDPCLQTQGAVSALAIGISKIRTGRPDRDKRRASPAMAKPFINKPRANPAQGK